MCQNVLNCHEYFLTKASGLDNISAEHLKYGSKRIASLAVCFTGFFFNGG